MAVVSVGSECCRRVVPAVWRGYRRRCRRGNLAVGRVDLHELAEPDRVHPGLALQIACVAGHAHDMTSHDVALADQGTVFGSGNRGRAFQHALQHPPQPILGDAIRRCARLPRHGPPKPGQDRFPIRPESFRKARLGKTKQALQQIRCQAGTAWAGRPARRPSARSPSPGRTPEDSPCLS